MRSKYLGLLLVPLLPLGCGSSNSSPSNDSDASTGGATTMQTDGAIPDGAGNVPSSGGTDGGGGTSAGTGGKGAGGTNAGTGGKGGSSTSTGGKGAGGSSTGTGGSGGTNAGTGGTNAGTGGKGAGGGGNVTPSAWVNVTGDLVNQAASGSDFFIVVAKPGSSRVIGGVIRGGLWATDDEAKTWFALGTGTGSGTITNVPTDIVFDPDHPDTFWESGSYGDGVFKTTDAGKTLIRVGDISHVDLVGIDFTDPDRKTMLAGGHEQQQKMYLSTDAGATWNDIGSSLPADSGYSNLTQVIDSKTFLVGTTAVGSGLGIYRSTNGGTSWTKVSSEHPAATPLFASDGKIYWPLSQSGIVVSSDKGVTWTKTSGMVSQNQTGSPVELPDGRIVALGPMNLVASSDGGKNWTPIGDTLPFPGANCGIYGVTYSVATKKLYINHNDCSGTLLPNSVYSADFDYTRE